MLLKKKNQQAGTRNKMESLLKGKFENRGNERAVLACVIQSPDLFLEVSAKLSAEDFISDHHKALYSVICSLSSQGVKAFDLMSVVNEATDKGVIDLVGGADYVHALLLTKVDPVNLDVFVGKVLDYSLKYKLYLETESIQSNILSNLGSSSDTSTAEELISSAEVSILDVSMDAQRIEDAVNICEGLTDHIKSLGEAPTEVLGRRTGIPLLDTCINGLTPGSLTVIAARQKAGKCLAGNSLILDADSGLLVPIKDFKGRVFSFSDGRFSKKSIYGPIANGKKKVFEISTRTGRKLIVTDNHPFLSPHGWVNIRSGNLFSGVKIAVPAILPFFGTVKASKEELSLLAYWISEGGKNDNIISAARKEVVKDICKAVKALGGSFTIIEGGVRIENFFSRLLKDYGLTRCFAYEKEFPKIVFSLNKSCLSHFINRLFSGDGWITNKEIGYLSSSEKLIDQLQHLLLRFGIPTIKDKRKGKYSDKDGNTVVTRDNFILVMRKKKHLELFIKEIGCVGRKQEILAVSAALKERTYGDVFGNPPKDFISVLQKSAVKKGLTLKELEDKIGYRFRGGMSNRILRKAAVFLKAPEILSLSSEELFWDEIVNIKAAGEDLVYDIQILEGKPNFVAQDILVHNSTLMMNMAANITFSLDRPGPILYIDTEMSTDEQRTRLVAHRSGIPERAITNGTFINDEGLSTRVIKACSDIEKGIFLHRYMPGYSIEAVRSLVRKYHAREGIVAFFFDYIKAPETFGSNSIKEYQVLGNITAALKDLAGQLKIPGVAAAQIKRGDSGAIKSRFHDSDVADSDRIGRYCNNLVAIAPKSSKERQEEGEACGTHRLQVLLSRGGGSWFHGIDLECDFPTLTFRQARNQSYTLSHLENNQKVDF